MRGLTSQRRAGQVVSSCLLIAVVLAACAPGARLPDVSRSTTGLLRPPPVPGMLAGPNQHVIGSPLPFPFEENHGQAPADVAYLLRAGSLHAAFGAQGVSYTLLAVDPGST